MPKGITTKGKLSGFDLQLLAEHNARPKNHLVLRRLVKDFLDHERLVEAKHFAKALELLATDGESLQLIFKVACRTCDQPEAIRVAKLLQASGFDRRARDELHATYYMTFNNVVLLKHALKSLSSHEIQDNESLTTLFQGVLSVADPSTSLAAVLHQGSRTTFPPDASKKLRKNILARIPELLRIRYQLDSP